MGLPMSALWCLAGFGVGVLLGLVFIGILLKVILYHWEGAGPAIKAVSAACSTLLGVGGGVVLFKFLPDQANVFYFLGTACGGIWGVYHTPVLSPNYTFESVRNVLLLGERVNGKTPDERAATVLAILAPPRSKSLSSGQLATRLEDALDNEPEDQTSGASDVVQ
jgi:hypothetical protein